jgi:hypothetical protein
VSDDPIPEEEEEIPSVADPEGAHNLLDARANRRTRKRIDNEAELASKFWRDVFSTPVGRREMWRLLSSGSNGDPLRPPFALGPSGFPQPEATWFEAGRYATAQTWLQIWSIYAREGVFAMLDEHDPRFAKPRKARRISD